MTSTQYIDILAEQGYTDIQKIGAGANSVVFRAKRDQNTVAVKITKKDSNTNNEIRILEYLKRKNVCTQITMCINFYKKVSVDHVKYFIIDMEYLENMIELKEYILKTAAISDLTKYLIIQNILNQLDLLHSTGIIHFDLKPQNILLNANTLETKIIDFGFSCLENDKKCYGLKGTPNYIDPVMAFDNDYGYHNDLWSMGIVIYYILHDGSVPWAGKKFQTVNDIIMTASMYSNKLQPITWSLNAEEGDDRDISKALAAVKNMVVLLQAK